MLCTMIRIGEETLPVGTAVLDILWYTRDGMVGLNYRETNTFQTIRESQILHVKLIWTQVRGRSRRGALECRRLLSDTSDEELMRLCEDRSAEMEIERKDVREAQHENEGQRDDVDANDISENADDTDGDDLDDLEEAIGLESEEEPEEE